MLSGMRESPRGASIPLHVNTVEGFRVYRLSETEKMAPTRGFAKGFLLNTRDKTKNTPT